MKCKKNQIGLKRDSRRLFGLDRKRTEERIRRHMSIWLERRKLTAGEKSLRNLDYFSLFVSKNAEHDGAGSNSGF